MLPGAALMKDDRHLGATLGKLPDRPGMLDHAGMGTFGIPDVPVRSRHVQIRTHEHRLAGHGHVVKRRDDRDARSAGRQRLHGRLSPSPRRVPIGGLPQHEQIIGRSKKRFFLAADLRETIEDTAQRASRPALPTDLRDDLPDEPLLSG